MVVFGPTSDAVGIGQFRRVVVLVKEIHAQVLREVDAATIGDRVGVPVFTVKIERVLRIRRQRGAETLLLADLFARAVDGVYQINVAHAGIVIACYSVSAVIPSDA